MLIRHLKIFWKANLHHTHTHTHTAFFTYYNHSSSRGEVYRLCGSGKLFEMGLVIYYRRIFLKLKCVQLTIQYRVT